jgi:hypothetical protein
LVRPLIEQWFSQVGYQHAHNSYLDLLGMPPVNCQASSG